MRGRIGMQADVYSFAIVLYELYSQQLPYAGLGLAPGVVARKVKDEGLRPSLLGEFPPAIRHLIGRCWMASPEERPSFTRIVEVLKTA